MQVCFSAAVGVGYPSRCWTTVRRSLPSALSISRPLPPSNFLRISSFSSRASFSCRSSSTCRRKSRSNDARWRLDSSSWLSRTASSSASFCLVSRASSSSTSTVDSRSSSSRLAFVSFIRLVASRNRSSVFSFTPACNNRRRTIMYVLL